MRGRRIASLRSLASKSGRVSVYQLRKMAVFSRDLRPEAPEAVGGHRNGTGWRLLDSSRVWV